MSASGKIIAPSVPTDKAEHLKQLMLKAHIPALSIAFISDNKITSADTLSLSNQQTNTDDVFWACSLSKPVFSYLVFKLWQAGELDKKNENGEIIEKFDPAATPLWTIFNDPRFNNDERRKALTADIILSHQSGLPNEAKAGIGSGDLEFEFKPGEKFKYSGEGLYYLQKVIEKIMAPKKLHNLAREFLFNPLGVSSKTTFKLTKDDSPVKNHDETGSPKTDFLRYHENNNNNAAGSLHTTAMDYALILTGILNDTDFINFITPRVDMQNDMEAKQQGVDAKTLRPISWSHGLGLQRSETNSDKASFAFHWETAQVQKDFL